MTLRPWLELARISNLPTVWTNILAAWLLADGKWEWKPLAWLLAGGSMIYTGGMFLNDAADVKFDHDHRKERPIPSGRISLVQAWIAAIVFLSAGFAMFIWGAEACIWLTGGLVTAVVVYDLFHKPWIGSVFIMGSCRTLLYLATASAVTGSIGFSTNAEVITKAVALGGYVTGISLVARGECMPHHEQTTSIEHRTGGRPLARRYHLGGCAGRKHSFTNDIGWIWPLLAPPPALAEKNHSHLMHTPRNIRRMKRIV
ncbi:MAG: UbiA family prenyltransferase [Verrucomicrobia bacterium]|nr:UbiA family prenyltransferase [Verrucomicrobiota bacterium]